MLILVHGASNVNAGNEKTTRKGGSFEGVRSSNSLHLGNRVWRDRATEYPTSLAALGPFDQANHASLITMAYTLALLRTRADWTSRDCCRHECVGRAERGDSANDPNAQRRTSAQVNP